MSTPTGPAPVMRFDDTLGAASIGQAIMGVIFGITTSQVYQYWRRYPNDHWFLRSMIFIAWANFAIYFPLMFAVIYHWTVSNYLNPASLLSAPWMVNVGLIAAALLDVISVWTYAFRLWKFDVNRLVIAFVLTCSAVFLSTGLAMPILELPTFDFVKFHAHYAWMWTTTFSLKMAADLTICITLCVVLSRRRTGLKNTDSVIRTLQVYLIQTSAVTNALELASILTFALSEDTFYFYACGEQVPPMIFLSLISLLNSRQTLREKAHEQSLSIHFPMTSRGERPSPSLGEAKVDNTLVRRSSDGVEV